MLIRGDAFASHPSAGLGHIQLPHPKDLSRQPAKALWTELLLFSSRSRLLPQARSTNERVLSSIRAASDAGVSGVGHSSKGARAPPRIRSGGVPVLYFSIQPSNGTPFYPLPGIIPYVVGPASQPPCLAARHTGHIFHCGK